MLSALIDNLFRYSKIEFKSQQIKYSCLKMSPLIFSASQNKY